MDASTPAICPRVHCQYFVLKYMLLNLCLNIYTRNVAELRLLWEL